MGHTTIKDVETKLQIRVGDSHFEDDDVKVYFADGFRKHDSNVALIATNKTIEFEKDKTDKIALPEDGISYEDEIKGQEADLAMWNGKGELEEDVLVEYVMYREDNQQHYANTKTTMKTCRGSG